MIALVPVAGIPEVRPGDDLAELIASALVAQRDQLTAGDILVVTSKIVSKAEGRFVETTDRAALVLEQSTAVVTERRTSTGMTRVVASVAGPVMAGAGIDASNADDDRLLLLPVDADASARALHSALARRLGHGEFGVLLSDTSGRPWRGGLTDFALGAAGVQLIDDLRGQADTAGRDLAVTVRNLGDALCAAADLVKGKVDRVPVAVVRGVGELVVAVDGSPGARTLVRSGGSDWFALGQIEAVRSALGVVPGTPAAYAVGVASVHPESMRTRAERALRLASYGVADGARFDVTLTEPSATRLHAQLAAPDPVTLGRVWARFEVACTSEQLRVVDARQGEHVELDIVDAAEAGPDPAA